jgi:acyl carrier protein
VSGAAELVLREVALLTGSTHVGGTNTWSELGLDSLDLFTLVTAVEEASGTVVTDAQVARMHRVQDLIDAVSG